MKDISILFIMIFFLSSITQAQTAITYDTLGRITTIEYANGTQVNYSYDDVGNRLTELLNPPLNWTGITSTDWHTTTNWGRGTIPLTIDNVIINSGTPHDPEILSNQSASCNQLTVDDGATVTLKSTNTGTGSLIVDKTVTNNGTITVERYLAENGWHFVTPSTTDVTANDFYWNDAPKSWLTSHDETTNEWTFNTPLTTPMPVEKGWSAWIDEAPRSNAIATMTGDIRTSDLPVSITKDGLGWNLVGNPFTSAIDWDEGLWGSNTTGTAYVWDNDYNGGDYRTWNGSTGDLTGGVIPISQGFFVQASTAGSFTIPATARVHSSTEFYKSIDNKDDSPYIRLQMDFEDYGNTVFIGFPENGTSQFDYKGDATKLYSYNDLPQVYVIEEGEKLSTNALEPLTEASKAVPLHLDQAVDGGYTFTLSQIENLPNVTITLEDLKLGVSQDLIKTPVYTFTASVVDDPERFLLHFNSNTFGTDDLVNPIVSLIHIYSSAKNIFIKSEGIATNERGYVQIFDITGRKVLEQRIEATNLISIPVELHNSYLIVKVLKPSAVAIEKVYIR